ncbi:hypothetical protein MAR_022525 [Mya arenaria]|uniref:Uncharacterized protein n=2 Tax=Mya arenaria TaxID=6604 RepID=A0ABY7DKE2_MYAAR|nr:hypothetical protein MAR_022525 [Mya arenaria]
MADDGQCTLPLSDGTWHSSTRGTWTVATSGGATEVSNFEAALSNSSNVATLTCQQSSGTQYILGTNFEEFFQEFINVSVCLDIRTISDENTDSYIFYFATAVDDATGERFTNNTDGACSEIGYETVANVQILVKDGFVASAAMQLPNLALGNYSVTYEVLLSAVTVENCTLDTCTNKTLMEFGNSDPTQYLGFTNGGQMYSIYTDSSGTDTFTLTYNADVSPDGINTHRFACWALLYSDGTLQATVLPEQCEGSQTSTAVTSGGQRLTMTPYFTCGPEEEAVGGLAGWVIALIVLGILALILIVAIIIVFICMCKTVASLDDEEMLKKEGSRQSTPDSLVGYKPSKREKPDRERTFDLTEIGKPGGGKKLQDGQPVEAEKRVETSKSVQLRKDIQGGESLGPIVFPPGKKPIPPTTPRPDKDDEVLLRIKKERERKEREREERRKKEKQAEELRIKMEVKKDPEEMVDKVIKHPKEPESSDEYETDDSEKEERAKQLMEKRRRLAGATWTPPGGLSNAKDVRHGHDEGELGGALVTREQQDQLEFDRRRQKKAMRKRAKGRRQQSDVSGSETDTDNGQRRRDAIFFKGPTGGLKADAVYIDSAQIERHEPVKAPARSQSQRPPASGSQMIKHLDTFEDGRPNMSRRNSRLRSSWTGNANLIPEEDNAMQGMSKGKRNIGSDDEFFLVVGSINQLSKPPEILDSQLGINRCTRYSERHGAPREPSGLTDISMRTAPDSTTPDNVNCRKYLEELYKDKIYFDKYVKTEKLPTNAAVETRELADHARSYLNNCAVYWKEHQPLNPAPPPSELRLKLSRMHTVHAEDSRKNSMPISVSERPLSADDIRDSTVASKAQSREVTMSLTTDRSAWAPVDTTGELVPPSPVGISGERVPPVGGPSGSIEKTVTIDEPSKNLTREKSSTKPPAPQKHSPAKKTSVATQEAVIPNNVMSLVDTS